MLRRILSLVALLVAIAPSTAAAATPRGFIGVVADGPVLDDAALERAGSGLERELDLMRRSGVESIRLSFYWASIQPAAGGPLDLRRTDRIVAAAARRRLTLMPVVLWPPDWAARHPGAFASPPADPEAYAAFVAALAERYGSRGSFWRERASLPRVPPTDWQLWNEPTLTNFWLDQPFARDYVDLLRRTRPALRRADPRARVVLAGLVHESWDALAKVYRANGRRLFDAVALHPFTREPSGVLRIIRRNRALMARQGDRRKPIIVSELSWPSSLGKVPSRYGYETDERGQARQLTRGMNAVAANRRKLGIERVYWYTWMTVETDRTYPFDYAGLRRIRRAGITSKPALAAYRRTAKRLAR